MDVCGIDPGLHVSGYAVVRAEGRSVSILDAGICRTDERDDLADRLGQLEGDIYPLLAQRPLDFVAVEQLFSHYKHPRTAILMGHARGVILAAAAKLGISVESFSPTQVKRFLTGNGRASKKQMQRVIKSTFGLATAPEPDDVADALAVGLCCANACRNHRPEVAPA